MMFESFQLDYEKYYIGGRKSANWLLTQFQTYGHFERPNILDWGCGPARILQHLPDLLNHQGHCFGTDYNVKTIDWCQQQFKNITFTKNEVTPPLSFADDFFQMIYGISIFTHLSQPNHYAWFAELSRILQSGGLLLLTTHGTVFRQRMTTTEKTEFDAGKLVVRANVAEGHRVFTTFHPPTFMRQLFESTCDILHHEPGKIETWGLNQDVWILRKKENS